MPIRPDAVAFDMNETLMPLEPLRERFTAIGLPPHLLELWFTRTLRDGIALAATGSYAPFAEVAAQALRIVSGHRADGTEGLGQLAMEKMLAGLSSRRYRRGLEPAGQAVEQAAAATSKPAVSRRFVAATETALGELMSRRLDDLDLVAFMVDGVHFGEHTCVVALGIGIDGVKHPLAIEEGSTENATLVTDLITGLRDRGLDVTKPILAVLDGAKALSRAVKDVFDQPLIQRCQPDRVDDRDLPGALQERQAVAGRDHGAALVRGRDARSPPPVPPRQRPPAPPEAPRRAGGSLHQECHCRKPE